MRRWLVFTPLLAWAVACPAAEPAEVALGNRLLNETRFTYGNSAVSCRSCHPGRGAEALPRHPVPSRNDGATLTPRRSPALQEAAVPASGGWGLLHWDGEFATPEDLVKATFLGRNFGWLPEEHVEAIRHFAATVRAAESAPAVARLSYAVLLRGDDDRIPAELRLPPALRIDVNSASDEAVVDACARLVVAAMKADRLRRDAAGRYAGSAYDAFLEANLLPRAPRADETPHEYARRLHALVAALTHPRFIDGPAGRFGPEELRGLRIFFRGTLGYGRSTGAGNCAECHVPPAFTDAAFHNTGATQDAYDAAHGAGTFAKLAVPTLGERNADFDRWLPPTPQHPRAAGPFRSATTAQIHQADLGLWNVYGNPDLPAPQSIIERKLNSQARLAPAEVLELTLARFKTPSLRNLGAAAPYLHHGGLATIEEVIQFYRRLSDLAQTGGVRNPPNEYAAMKLAEEDIAPLAAFLRALNEQP